MIRLGENGKTTEATFAAKLGGVKYWSRARFTN
jgi:hypothetical protein